MKKLLILLALLFPVVSFAATNPITISPLSLTCGEQNADVVFNFDYSSFPNWLPAHIVTYLDGSQIDHYNHKPATVTENVHFTVGTHEVKATNYLIEWDATHFDGPYSSASQSVTVNACPPIEPPATTTPPIEPPATTTPPIEPPATTTPPVEPPATTTPPVVEEPPVIITPTAPQSNSGNGGGSSPALRLCYLSGGQICLPLAQTIEMIKAQMVLIDAYLAEIIKANAGK